ncbi:hypothetical protein MM326_11045 [Alkalihalobacillus sp. LMS6]|uniref:hypothetical protein n=1 Tax=Alkalihalobacillus sp. LMS6 TaxID=2924034 RepID=UPI0020D1613F|nr:hypothetical protein [Alkalihalobacillus sp. LMS6]UTR04677.1 hypothetical protein MM326_11045 [Alkalihalobacillus sp. LMS6]
MKKSQEKGIIIAGIITVLFMFSSLLSFDSDENEQVDDRPSHTESQAILLNDR